MNREVAVFLTILALMLPSCGRKAPPVPPGTLKPRPVEKISYEITTTGIKLMWKVPLRHTDGSPIARIKGFELFKAELPPEESCGECPISFGDPVFIPYRGKPERDRTVIYEDRTVSTEAKYVYAVRIVKGILNKSALSKRLEVAWHVPPGIPTGLKATRDGAQVILEWEGPDSYLDGTPLDRDLEFSIYRKPLGSEAWERIGKVKGVHAYRDTGIEKGVVYEYRVSASVYHLGERIEGEPSATAEAQAIDIRPPSAPKGLVATVTRKGVELRWKANDEADLRGYMIYRSDEAGLVVRLNHVPVMEPLFMDRTVLPPGRYRYWVTAVDMAVPYNESSRSAPAEIRIERYGR